MPEPDRVQRAAWPVWATERVEVVDHDPAWAGRGLRERDFLQELLAPWLTAAVEHVGSTSVPGLAAKPIIDLQAQVATLDVADEIVPLAAYTAGKERFVREVIAARSADQPSGRRKP
ncbi:hypothetical protein GCM10010464_03040 [Pseudonocardia yunnanensis]|uniref:GrpB family protein n=1 Tax=Pseudonocardia yunnanensis TaxID=58107 RepID=A0ABW4ERR7_9PSEU